MTPYNTRLSLALHKLSAAMGALGRLDHAGALGYALSMAHDAAALTRAVRKSRRSLALEVQCHGAGQRARWWGLPAAAGVVCLLLVTYRLVRGRRGGGGGGGGGWGGGGSSKIHSF